MSSNQIYVSIEFAGQTHVVGKLWLHQRGARQSASFEYDPGWLNNPQRFAFDPALQLGRGTFHTDTRQTVFGAIGDSAPDRWGRVLMRRAESMRAKEGKVAARTLSELDYLLGVSDEARQGALRFSVEANGPYLAQKSDSAMPQLIDLPRLLSATERYLHDDAMAEDIKLLLSPGSSLGGARPKASVYDKGGRLSIAKFPNKGDEYNVVAWEAVALALAEKSGIRTAKFRMETIKDKPVLLVQRFDRKSGNRIPFLSAMSMLGAVDNEQRSYMEIADAIAQHSGNPERDTEELWRRIVFSILITNSDDHLRNHGFLYTANKGWRLSPAYDLNPVPIESKARVLSTSISFNDASASIDTALSVIEYFRLGKDRARQIIKEVASTTKNWQDTARKFAIHKKEMDYMASAFEHGELHKALK